MRHKNVQDNGIEEIKKVRKKIFLYSAAILLALNIFCWNEVFVLVLGENVLKVYFLDVGQGDAAFIETPQHHQILIDGGPDSTVLSKLQDLMPAKDMSLDLIILTHPEKDHIAGFLDVLQRYKVDYILWTGVVRDTPEYNQWVKLLKEEQADDTQIIISQSGQEIIVGDVTIDTLYPLENLEGRKMEKTSNDSCIVSRLVFGNNSFLFTGDIDSQAEKELVNQGSDLSSNVLKVAHHGSKYSTSELFLENVGPEIAVIEVGKNSYGHPTPEVLQRLDKFGIKVLRTDTDGDIEMVSDGNTINVKNTR